MCCSKTLIITDHSTRYQTKKTKITLPFYLAGHFVDCCIEKMVPTGNSREEITISTVNEFLIRVDEYRSKDVNKYNEMRVTDRLHWEDRTLTL
jgi:hypothetical protein